MKDRFCGLMFVLLLLPQWSKESQDKGLCTETCPPQLFDYFFCASSSWWASMILHLLLRKTFTPISVLPTCQTRCFWIIAGYTKSFTVQSQTHNSSTMSSAQLRSRRCDANLLTEQGHLTKGNVTSFSPHIWKLWLKCLIRLISSSLLHLNEAFAPDSQLQILLQLVLQIQSVRLRTWHNWQSKSTVLRGFAFSTS